MSLKNLLLKSSHPKKWNSTSWRHLFSILLYGGTGHDRESLFVDAMPVEASDDEKEITKLHLQYAIYYWEDKLLVKSEIRKHVELAKKMLEFSEQPNESLREEIHKQMNEITYY